jgi:hypothetical protein
MKLTNIHDVWGSIIEFDNPLDFFKYPKGYWRDLIYKRKLLIFKKMNFTPADYGRFSFHFGRPWEREEYLSSLEKPIQFKEDGFDYNFSLFYNGYSESNNSISIDQEMHWHADLPNYGEDSFPFNFQ